MNSFSWVHKQLKWCKLWYVVLVDKLSLVSSADTLWAVETACFKERFLCSGCPPAVWSFYFVSAFYVLSLHGAGSLHLLQHLFFILQLLFSFLYSSLRTHNHRWLIFTLFCTSHRFLVRLFSLHPTVSLALMAALGRSVGKIIPISKLGNVAAICVYVCPDHSLHFRTCASMKWCWVYVQVFCLFVRFGFRNSMWFCVFIISILKRRIQSVMLT